jgi:hypothetical protein
LRRVPQIDCMLGVEPERGGVAEQFPQAQRHLSGSLYPPFCSSGTIAGFSPSPLARERNRVGTPLPQEGRNLPWPLFFKEGNQLPLLGMMTLSFSQSRRAVWEWPRTAFHMALFSSSYPQGRR